MSSTALALLFLSASQTYSLPPGLLSSVCFVESGHRVNAVHRDDGGENSLGICQLHLSTARYMGYKGTYSNLMNPSVNIKYSAKYLKHLLDQYHGDLVKAIVAYNSGHFSTKNKKYVNKVFTYWGKYETTTKTK